MLVKEEQLYEKLVRSVDMVAGDITNTESRAPLMTFKRRSPLSLLGEFPTMVKDRYTQYEIAEKLANAFKATNIPPTKFEFASIFFCRFLIWFCITSN